MQQRGRVTIPTDVDVVPETLTLMERWGADAIRDCDGTDYPEELRAVDAKVYSTYYTTRKDNTWAKAHPEEIQQMYIMTSFHTATKGELSIHLMDHLYPDMLAVNTRDDIRRWWEVIDRTTGEAVSTEEWSYDEKNGNVVMINHFIYNIKDPSRGDIAAFQKDGDERYFVKRIVGLPGETVQIKDGLVYINGEALKEDKMRYRHTLGVADTSACLAMRYGVDMQKAYIAGLLHDCAKCVPDTVKLEECNRYGIEVTEFEKNSLYLLHAKLGAYYAKKLYHIEDASICSAIYWHTTGHAGMTKLEEIVYIADYIEPYRNHAQNLDTIRPLAFTDLEKAIYQVTKDTLAYLKKKGGSIDPATIQTYEYYQKLVEKGEK